MAIKTPSRQILGLILNVCSLLVGILEKDALPALCSQVSEFTVNHFV